MRNVSKLLISLFTVLTLSCAKDGATGPQGPAGADGANGTNGNANVKVYTFASHDFSVTSSKSLSVTTTADTASNSAWLIYLVRASGNVYPIPGFGVNGTSDYRAFWIYGSPSVNFTISKVSGAGDLYSNIRIIRIFASGLKKDTHGNSTERSKSWESLSEMEKAKSLYPNVDFLDYNAVVKAFNLKD
jgi:hypothetical protein